MSITGEIAKVKDGDPTNLITRRQEDFKMVLPSQWNEKQVAWIRLAQAAVNKSPDLRRIATSNPGSLMRALMECARLGHEPGTNRFYLVPKGSSIEGWESWRGVVQRILNSGRYQKVVAEVVYEGEEFTFDPNNDDRPTHVIDWSARSKGAKPHMSYAYAVHHDGKATRVGVADPAYIAKVRAMGGPVWNKWEAEMYLKSAVNRLEAFVATSSEDHSYTPPTVEVGEPILESADGDMDADTDALDAELITDVSDATIVEEYPAADNAGVEDAETVEL